MSRRCGFCLVLVALAIATPAMAQRYTAAQQGEVVTLADRAADAVVTIVPSVGNIAYRDEGQRPQRPALSARGSMAEFKARPGATGIPFMGPWANRLDEQAFYANGKPVRVRHGARQRPRRDSRSTAS